MAVTEDTDVHSGSLVPPTTRSAILLAARGCFARAGYDGTSLNDIAAEVGIRRPSLLHHFPSKDALYGEVFEQLISDWLERVETEISSIGGEPAALGWPHVERVLDAGFRFFAENPDYVRLMRREALDDATHLAVDLAAVMRPMFDRAVAYLRAAMDAGALRPHEPEQLLLTGYGALLSYFSDAPLVTGLLDGDPLGDGLVEVRRRHVLQLFAAALAP